MEALFAIFAAFVALCIFCAFWVGVILLLIGIFYIMIKAIIWMAYMGAIFIALGIVGFLLVKSCETIRNYFS